MPDEAQQAQESIWERRRRAPFHFLAKADNARMSAYILSQTEKAATETLASEIGYSGTPSIALSEGFRREASIAMELILKAIVTVLTKAAPKPTHNVYELWTDANLPPLGDNDFYRLALMTELLYWSGRYAAPTSSKKLAKSRSRFEKHQKSEQLGEVRIIKPTPFGWDEFEKLYQIAYRRFWKLESDSPSNFVV